MMLNLPYGLRFFVAAALAVFTSIAAVSAPKYEAEGGIKMGYSSGQNGQAWPKPWAPLVNHNRAGFYISHFRAEGAILFDTTFSGRAVLSLESGQLLELCLIKQLGRYTIRAGRFKGAGLKSATGQDEFDLYTIYAPFYSGAWAAVKNQPTLRDMGIQLERSFFDQRLNMRLFIHNATGQNVKAFPSQVLGASSQALGIDLAADLRFSGAHLAGGHFGARDNEHWQNFVSWHGWWKAQYWFKSNTVSDASVFHQYDFGSIHTFTEALLLYNRQIITSQGTPMQSWGVSHQIRKELSDRHQPAFRYEFYDHSDGVVKDDGLHIFTFSWLWAPSPGPYPGLRFTAEYTHVREEGARDLVHNDVALIQFQLTL